MQASKIWKIKARKFISENRQSIAHVWSSFCFSQKFKPQDFYEIISEQWNIIMETAKHKWRWSVSRCTSIFNSAELSGLLKLENSSRQSQFNLTLVIFANNTAGVVTSLWVYLFHTGAWARVSAIQKARKLCTKPLRQKKEEISKPCRTSVGFDGLTSTCQFETSCSEKGAVPLTLKVSA